MAVLVVFVFMRDWRSTAITAIALPTSVIATFFFMYAAGFTINMMTLMALSLVIGILIDDAVVVRENIYRHMEHGEDPYTAARKGTSEIGLAVMATTFTILAVFLPVGFMTGIVGQFFKSFALTIAFAVSISLLVAFTLDPMLSSVWHDPSIHRSGVSLGKRSWYDLTLGRVTQWFEDATVWLGRLYQHLLEMALRHKLVTVLMALGIEILDGFQAHWYINLFRYILLLSAIIPISLRVNMDMAKIYYCYTCTVEKILIGENIERLSFLQFIDKVYTGVFG